MSAQNSPQRFNLAQYADRFRNQMVPLGARFCYYCATPSIGEEELREYLDEPVAALPPVISNRLPDIKILLVPYLEKAAQSRSRSAGEPLVTVEKPQASQSLDSGSLVSVGVAVLAFAVNDTEVADYHYRFYRAIAELVAGRMGKGIPKEYIELLRSELTQGAHGEVDEPAWRLKLELEPADARSARAPKRFRDYAYQSFVDTLTLYMHGICCDIDVETGPRQLASNLLRKRLKLLKETYPPPATYAVFPEDL